MKKQKEKLEYLKQFQNFLQTSLDIWGKERTIEVVMSKETISNLFNDIKFVLEAKK